MEPLGPDPRDEEVAEAEERAVLLGILHGPHRPGRDGQDLFDRTELVAVEGEQQPFSRLPGDEVVKPGMHRRSVPSASKTTPL